MCRELVHFAPNRLYAGGARVCPLKGVAVFKPAFHRQKALSLPTFLMSRFEKLRPVRLTRANGEVLVDVRNRPAGFVSMTG